MTIEAQRIAVATACGWTKGDHDEPGFGGANSLRLVTGWNNAKGIFFRTLPDYLSDLNAMHEAEKVLFQSKLTHKYKLALADLPGFGGNNHDRIWHATAAQRAEAFLRTLNLWDDTK